jgi:hypothetical protein
LEPYLQDYKCFNEILQIKFLQYIVYFLTRDVLNQFQLRACNVYPPAIFSTDLAFLREWFLWRLGWEAVVPPLPPGYATVSGIVSNINQLHRDTNCRRLPLNKNTGPDLIIKEQVIILRRVLIYIHLQHL